MPSVGWPELIIIALWLLIPLGIGYWCMTVFRSKGKSAGGGFALGFLLTLVLSLIGAIVAMLIAYLSSPAPSASTHPSAVPPPPPPPVSPNAQTIATFGPTTGWHGKRIGMPPSLVPAEESVSPVDGIVA